MVGRDLENTDTPRVFEEEIQPTDTTPLLPKVKHTQSKCRSYTVACNEEVSLSQLTDEDTQVSSRAASIILLLLIGIFQET